MKNSISQLDQAYEICRKETQKWAKTFYLGTLLLPIEKRKAIWAIYVWCRRTDEIMDSLEASTKSQDELSDNLNALGNILRQFRILIIYRFCAQFTT